MDLKHAIWELGYEYAGAVRTFNGNVIARDPEGHPEIVAVVKDERAAKLIASTPRLFKALAGLLRHHGTFFPFGLNKKEKRAIRHAREVYGEVATLILGEAAPAELPEGHQ